jgi:hypothetical protein
MLLLKKILLFVSLLTAGCLPVERVIIHEVAGGNQATPTHVVLIERTLPPATEEAPEEQIIGEEVEPDPGADDLDTYYGGLAITLDNVGQTLMMKPKQGFLLKLGESFVWSVSFTRADVVTSNQKVTLEPGEQGVFVARTKGKTSLVAIGKPQCLQDDPPCTRPDVMFQMDIIVE